MECGLVFARIMGVDIGPAKAIILLEDKKMAKQRPSKTSRKSSPAWALNRAAPKAASFWRKRLFKSIFTRGGRSIAVKGWAIRIQFQGIRRTFSLGTITRSAASLKAEEIYQTIRTRGWDVAAQLYSKRSAPVTWRAAEATPAQLSKTGARYWKLRLLRRKHPSQSQLGPSGEFSVRIEYGGISHYFPLGTLDEEAAAKKALEIYRTVVSKGWGAATLRFSRELTLGFHWVANPLAWTYTTIHTRVDQLDAPPGPVRSKSPRNIAIVESDAGIGQAIAWYLQFHQPFLYAVAFANAGDALREIPRRSIRLTLSNHSLPDMSGDRFLEKLRVFAPKSLGLIYSVYEDSDQLFKATPGGASGYLLKRTSPEQMLEPIGGLLSKGPLSRQQILQQVRQSFRDVTTLLQSSDEVQEIGKLTPREKEILDSLSKGRLDKEIAHTLGISVWTVHGHLKSIFEKFRVHSRTEAVVKYLQK